MSDSGWNQWLEDPCLFWRPGDYNYQTPKHDPKKAIYTPEQEQERFKEEVENSEGFDIDFDSFRCVFNYHPLDGRNATYKTDFEFVSVVKANFHYSAGFMFLITFEVRDPYDGLIKLFQAGVRHLKHTFTEHVFCRPKPNAGVEYYGTAKTDLEKNTKKQRLE
ncbi:unnamed protein product [Brassica oleracea var. botrytis]